MCRLVEQPINAAQAQHLGAGIALDMNFPIKVRVWVIRRPTWLPSFEHTGCYLALAVALPSDWGLLCRPQHWGPRWGLR